MIKIESKRGITLLALVLTIVVLLILVAFTISAGKDTIEFSKKTKFMAYMQLIQKKVDVLAQSGGYEEMGEDYSLLSKDKKDQIKENAQNERTSLEGLLDLPAEYQEVEYVGSRGAQYIDTEYNASARTHLIMTFSYGGTNNGQYSNGMVFGSANNNNGKPSFCIGISKSDVVYLRNSDVDGGDIGGGQLDTTTKYEIDAFENKIEVNGVLNTQEISLLTATQNYSSYIFARHQPPGANEVYCCMKGRVYDCIIYENDEMKRNFIPCYRKADNKTGMYDLTENKFYSCQGTGEFDLGEEIHTNNYFRYFDSEALARDLDIDDVDDEIFVNFDTREVISLNGIEYEGQMYYSQYNLPGGQKLEQETETSRELEITSIEQDINGLNGTFILDGISITNGTISYTATHGETNPNTSTAIVTDHTVAGEAVRTNNITMSGEYTFKLKDNTNNSVEECEPITLKLTNSPSLKGNLDDLTSKYNYSDLSDSTNWAFATDSITGNIYVWIPRYAYKTSDSSKIEFLKGTTDLTTSGGYITNDWTIPEVFEDKTGVWVGVTSYYQEGLNIISILNNATIL